MKKKTGMIPYIVIVCYSILLFYRCFYGIDNGDEGFYISLAHRLYMGEALLVDDWYPAQLFAVFLLPFYKVFCFFVPSGEGIFLFFRIVSLLIKMICAFFFYRVMIRKNKNQWTVLVAALLFYVYERDNILSLSYYFMGMVMAFVAGVLLYCVKQYAADNRQYVIAFFSGVCFAIATVSNPYLAIIYLIGMIYLAIQRKQRRINRGIIGANVGGVIIVTVCFFTFVLQRAGIAEIIDNLPFILNDPIHPTRSLPYEFARWFWIIIKEYGWLSIIISTLSVIYSAIKRYLNRPISKRMKKGIFIINSIV